MNRKDIITGSIFEIPLEKEFGFGYVKLIFQSDIQPSCRVDDVIIKPYNIFRKNSMDKNEFNPKPFETDNIITFPILMNGLPRLRGEGKWILKGNSCLTVEDRVVPDYLFVGLMSPMTQKKIKEACNSEHGCRVNLGDLKDGENFEYFHDFNSINHLGKNQHASSNGIRSLLSMLWMKKKNINILEYYSISDFEHDFWLKYTYDTVIKNDFDFSKVKFEGRLKVK